MSQKKLVILSGAGISAESGLKTFRDGDGLWENYDIHEVATIDAWRRDPELVLSFYDERRHQVLNVQPNKAHKAIVELEKHFDVHIVTQNIDDLHERAGSTNILHLHGEILKARSASDDRLIINWKKDIALGDHAPDGNQLRPHVVWFGEPVPAMYEAEKIVRSCDILLVIGTSLNVYPAAGLCYACPPEANRFIVDPNNLGLEEESFIHFQGTATEKVPQLVDILIQDFKNT
jgi:NAD-dependent deacetylase